MSKRKIGQRIHKQSQKVATIYRLPETREYMVAFEGNPAADYFTNCQNDAYGTAYFTNCQNDAYGTAERWAQGN